MGCPPMLACAPAARLPGWPLSDAPSLGLRAARRRLRAAPGKDGPVAHKGHQSKRGQLVPQRYRVLHALHMRLRAGQGAGGGPLRVALRAGGRLPRWPPAAWVAPPGTLGGDPPSAPGSVSPAGTHLQLLPVLLAVEQPVVDVAAGRAGGTRWRRPFSQQGVHARTACTAARCAPRHTWLAGPAARLTAQRCASDGPAVVGPAGAPTVAGSAAGWRMPTAPARCAPAPAAPLQAGAAGQAAATGGGTAQPRASWRQPVIGAGPRAGTHAYRKAAWEQRQAVQHGRHCCAGSFEPTLASPPSPPPQAQPLPALTCEACFHRAVGVDQHRAPLQHMLACVGGRGVRGVARRGAGVGGGRLGTGCLRAPAGPLPGSPSLVARAERSRQAPR